MARREGLLNFSRCLLGVLSLLLLPADIEPVNAAENSGELKGIVRDANGTPLPGVVVEIKGANPSLEKTAKSDGGGGFTFRALPPGAYALKYMASGYRTLEQEIVVNVAWETSVVAEMTAEEPGERLPAAAQAQLVDSTRTNTEDDYTREYLEKTMIGSSGRDYLSVLRNSPGAGPGDGANPTVRGSTIGENVYMVDGVDTTDPFTATFGSNLIFDAISEVRLQTGGFTAEFGRSTGGLINVMTKSGGNEFQGSIDLRYRNQDLITKGDHLDPNRLTQKHEVVEATLGGPIVKDKLWFFVAGSFIDSDLQPSGSPALRSFGGRYYLGKLSWRITSGHKLSFEVCGDPATIDNADASPVVAKEATSRQTQGSQFVSLQYHAVFTPNLLLHAQAAYFRSDLDFTPQSGDLTTIGQVNLLTGDQTANSIDVQYSDRFRKEANVAMTWRLPSAAGEHTFKLGLDVQALKFGFRDLAPGGEFDEVVPDPNGLLVPILFNEVSSAGRVNNTGAVAGYFAQDEWRLHPRLSLNAGLRLDAFTYDDNDRRRVFDASLLEPRAGLVWDMTGDAKNLLKAYGGVFEHPSLLALPQAANTRANRTDVFADERITGDLNGDNVLDPHLFIVSSGGPGGTVFAHDGHLSATNVLEYSLAYDRRLGNRSLLGLTLVKRRTRDIIEDRFDTTTGKYVIDNVPGLSRRHSGAELRYSTTLQNFRLWASYAYGVSRGNIEYTQGLGTDFDFPVLSVNRYGYLSDDARHAVRANGYWGLPLGFEVGYAYLFSTGRPENLERIAFPYGEEFIRPRGYLRMPTFQQLDVEGRKTFRLGKTKLQLIATILNVMGTEIVTSTDSLDVNHHALTYQTPRRYEAGLRYSF